jgi:steroid delta-isomerase-like uncharacterized protein
MAELTAHAKSVVEAFNDSDWAAARGLMGDSTYNEIGTQRSLAGPDAILEALQGWKAAMPDAKGTVTSAVESGQQVVLEVTWEGTQTGELVTDEGTIAPSGKRQTTPAAFIFDYENGNLKESRHYFDMLAFLKQIGAA